MIFLAGTILAFLSANSWALPSRVERAAAASPIQVSLEQQGNSVVKASIHNAGDRMLNLLKKGTLLDEHRVQKLHVYSEGSILPFEGVKLALNFHRLPQETFTTLAPNETVEVTIDAAELYDLSSGGPFEIRAQGAMPWTEVGSTKLKGPAIPFLSNKLAMAINGTAASEVRREFISSFESIKKRTNLSNDCTGDNLEAIQAAHSNCADLARNASDAIATSTFEEYFKTMDGATQMQVANRFLAVADECSSLTEGNTESHCTDTYNACDSGVLAYTLPMDDYIVYCDLFFDALPALSDECHAQDHATVVIHELTHAPGVYNPGTDDLGYGYEAATALDTQDALNNADSFALFANSVYAQC